MDEKYAQISKKYSDTILILTLVCGGILTFLWYILAGMRSIWVPIAICAVSALLFLRIIKPKMDGLLKKIYSGKK